MSIFRLMMKSRKQLINCSPYQCEAIWWKRFVLFWKSGANTTLCDHYLSPCIQEQAPSITSKIVDQDVVSTVFSEVEKQPFCRKPLLPNTFLSEQSGLPPSVWDRQESSFSPPRSLIRSKPYGWFYCRRLCLFYCPAASQNIERCLALHVVVLVCMTESANDQLQALMCLCLCVNNEMWER